MTNKEFEEEFPYLKGEPISYWAIVFDHDDVQDQFTWSLVMYDFRHTITESQALRLIAHIKEHAK